MRKCRSWVSLATWWRASTSRWLLLQAPVWPLLNEIITNSALHLPFLLSRPGEKGPIEYISAKRAVAAAGLLSLVLPGSLAVALANFTALSLKPRPSPGFILGFLPLFMGNSSSTYFTFILYDSTQLLGFGTVSLKGNEFTFKNDFTLLTSKDCPQTNHTTP